MTVLARLDLWKSTGAISADQYVVLSRLARRDRVSLFLELNLLLYVGVLSLVAGVGWTITTYSERLGDAAILSALTAAFCWSLYYCAERSRAYAPGEVESPGLAFDYVLYLGCLLFALDLGYLESRFHPFQADWDHLLLVASAVFFTLAYRFDNRLVLSLALSSLGGWFGVRVSRFDVFGASLRPWALLYGGLVGTAGAALHRAGIKRHFLETYLHVAAAVLFAALASGVDGGDWLPYFVALLGLAAFAIVEGVRFRRFAFVVYGVVFSYAGISVRFFHWNRSFMGAMWYFVVSGAIVIVALVVLARQFGRDA